MGLKILDEGIAVRPGPGAPVRPEEIGLARAPGIPWVDCLGKFFVFVGVGMLAVQARRAGGRLNSAVAKGCNPGSGPVVEDAKPDAGDGMSIQ